MNDVTRILSQIETGDPQAAGQLLPLVYDELRKAGRPAPEEDFSVINFSVIKPSNPMFLSVQLCRSAEVELHVIEPDRWRATTA